MVGELLQRKSLALILITLAGDVELNPSFRRLVDAIDVLTLSETCLDSNIQDSEICLPGFTLVRRDREGTKSGGGVAIYVRDGLPFRVRNNIGTGENECLWIQLNRAKCKPTLIYCLYRAPNADFTKFISSLENCMPR